MSQIELDEEVLDVLYSVTSRTDGTVAVKFINGNSEKVPWILSRDAARDLCDELSDLSLSDW